MQEGFRVDEQAYFHLNADCIAVRGSVRSAIYDLSRQEIALFPTTYYGLLEQLQRHRFGEVMETASLSPQSNRVQQFIGWLMENEFGMFVSDHSLFPPIDDRWEECGLQNAIIDVDAILHDFPSILKELDALGCQFLQIRSFSNLLSLDNLKIALSAARNKTFDGVEIIIKYDASIGDESYRALIREHPLVYDLTVHSSPTNRELSLVDEADSSYEHLDKRKIRFTSQAINNESHCGLISINTLHMPSPADFFEAKRFNGCLNGKISVDKEGVIRNCPSMQASYGMAGLTPLRAVVADSTFRECWKINKDLVKVCSDCEFRYGCSDCRAYLEVPDDQYGKPLKCGYDPYSTTWTDWATDPRKSTARQRYCSD